MPFCSVKINGPVSFLHHECILIDFINIAGSRDATMGIWKIKDDVTGPFSDGDMSFDHPMAESVPEMESLGMFTNSSRRTVHSTKIRSMAINKNLGVCFIDMLHTCTCPLIVVWFFCYKN